MTETRRGRALLRTVRIAVAAGALAAIVATGAGVVLADFSRASTEAALNTLVPAGSRADRLLAEVVDQETGERGYVITMEPSFLQPYLAGRRAIPGLFRALRADLAGRHRDLRLLAQFGGRYDRWSDTFAIPQIHDVAVGKERAAVAKEKSGAGKAMFDSLRRSMAALTSRIDTEEHSALSRARVLQDALVVLMAAIGLCLLAGSLLILILLRRSVVRPIESLNSEVSRVAAGDLDHEVASSGPTEIEVLGGAVEHMRRRLRRAVDETTLLREVTETLQRALAPVVSRSGDRFEVETRYLPGSRGVRLGGDWFNVIPVDDDRYFFSIGDVSGHGLTAATEMARLRFAIEAYATEDPSPDRVLTRVAKLCAADQSGHFATVLCGLCDAGAGTVALSNAGHPPPLVIIDGRAEFLPVPPSPPIFVHNGSYEVTRYDMAVGTSLVAYTDGLIERRWESITDSLHRLREAACTSRPLRSLLTHLLTELIPEGAPDDVALLAIQFLGAKEPTTAGEAAPAASDTSPGGGGVAAEREDPPR